MRERQRGQVSVQRTEYEWMEGRGRIHTLTLTSTIRIAVTIGMRTLPRFDVFCRVCSKPYRS